MSRSGAREKIKFLFIQGKNLKFPEKLRDIYFNKDGSPKAGYKVVGDGERDVSISEIRDIAPDLEIGARVDINAHGQGRYGFHALDLKGPFRRTSSLFDALSKSGHPIETHLWSCFGGNAVSSSDKLPKDSILVAHAPKKRSVFVTPGDDEMLESLEIASEYYEKEKRSRDYTPKLDFGRVADSFDRGSSQKAYIGISGQKDKIKFTISQENVFSADEIERSINAVRSSIRNVGAILKNPLIKVSAPDPRVISGDPDIISKTQFRMFQYRIMHGKKKFLNHLKTLTPEDEMIRNLHRFSSENLRSIAIQSGKKQIDRELERLGFDRPDIWTSIRLFKDNPNELDKLAVDTIHIIRESSSEENKKFFRSISRLTKEQYYDLAERLSSKGMKQKEFLEHKLENGETLIDIISKNNSSLFKEINKETAKLQDYFYTSVDHIKDYQKTILESNTIDTTLKKELPDIFINLAEDLEEIFRKPLTTKRKKNLLESFSEILDDTFKALGANAEMMKPTLDKLAKKYKGEFPVLQEIIESKKRANDILIEANNKPDFTSKEQIQEVESALEKLGIKDISEAYEAASKTSFKSNEDNIKIKDTSKFYGMATISSSIINTIETASNGSGLELEQKRQIKKQIAEIVKTDPSLAPLAKKHAGAIVRDAFRDNDIKTKKNIRHVFSDLFRNKKQKSELENALAKKGVNINKMIKKLKESKPNPKSHHRSERRKKSSDRSI